MFIAITMNHIQAVKAWGEVNGAHVNLDILNFELEIKAHHRYFTLFPQFLAQLDGRLMHVSQLTRAVRGFIGWLPYRPIRWSLASDKLLFKQRLTQAELATPASWSTPAQATGDFIVKNSVGSFGNELAGPYHPGQKPDDLQMQVLSKPGSSGSIYMESFVQGTNVKVWFWGDCAFHAQFHSYPVVTGNGQSTVKNLADMCLKCINKSWEGYAEKFAVVQALAYQGLELDMVLPSGHQAWLDYRYGRRFAADAMSEGEDNALPRLPVPQRKQIENVGRWLAAELQKEIDAPVLYSVDGVMDRNGKIWWLEANSNPIFPPTGYGLMLSTLFGTPVNALATVASPSSPSILTTHETTKNIKEDIILRKECTQTLSDVTSLLSSLPTFSN